MGKNTLSTSTTSTTSSTGSREDEKLTASSDKLKPQLIRLKSSPDARRNRGSTTLLTPIPDGGGSVESSPNSSPSTPKKLTIRDTIQSVKNNDPSLISLDLRKG